MHIKTYEYRLIDSCCFLSIPLSMFSNTFNYSDMVTFPNNYGYVGLRCYEPDGIKEPAHAKLIEWHREQQTTNLFLTVGTTNSVRLTSFCMKFRALFLGDTGI